MKADALVQHRHVTFLARVVEVDPKDNNRVIIQPLIDGSKAFSCAKSNLLELG